MSFSFMRSTSHRPDDEHLEEEEDEEGQMPMLKSGGVRAFSHLPPLKKPWLGEAALQELMSGGGQLPFTSPEPVNKPDFEPLGGSMQRAFTTSEPVNKPEFKPLGGSMQRPFTTSEPVNKPAYFDPAEDSRQRPYRQPEPDYDVYRKPPNHRPEDDFDLYKEPPNHRREDDFDVYRKKKPSPLLDDLQHLEENEDGDELRPLARSGMVRAFSHLPERREAEEGADAGADTYTLAGQEIDTRSWHPGHGNPEEGDDADHEQQPASDSGRSLAASPQEPGFGQHPQDVGFDKPSAQGWGQSGPAGSLASPSPSTAPGPFGGSSLPEGRLLEQRLPPGARNEAKNPPPNLFKDVVDTHDAATASPFTAKAVAPAQPGGPTQQNQAATTAAQVAASPSSGTALEPANRVRKLDETVPKKPVKPKQTRRSPTEDKIIRTPDEQFAREMAAYEREKAAYEKALATATANHKLNHDNEQTFKAWENYDRAIQLMERTPEGRKVLDRLRNDKDRVFKVVMLNNPATDTYLGRKLKHGAKGQYIYTGEKDEQGREIHVLLLDKTGINGDTLKKNGQIDPDAESLENIWHELYHAYERHGSPSDSIDPLGVGTVGPTDRWLPPVSHEKRAVRFENIIRARNKGTRKKDRYGGGKYPDPDGVVRDHPPLLIPDELPPLTPVP